MEDKKIYIKNMVCPRCIETVRDILIQSGIGADYIELGKIITSVAINRQQKQTLAKELEKRGFELLEDKTSKLIAQIKAIIINQIHHHSDNTNINFSTLLSEKIAQDYTFLSKLFSSVEGVTIERYIIRQKIEKVKELIVYNELSLSEIAFRLNYSSVAHLSSQFKKETGMTPSVFKGLDIKSRKNLDAL